MKKLILMLAATFILAVTGFSQHLKKDGTPDRRFKENKSYYSAPTYSSHHAVRYTTSSTAVQRDTRGRIRRSERSKHQFEKQTGYPHGRPGYVIDHIIPLKRGGCDCPSNMQWQTIAEGKAKDKTE